MEHVLAILKNALTVAKNNAPIHLAAGNQQQADLCRIQAAEIEQFLTFRSIPIHVHESLPDDETTVLLFGRLDEAFETSLEWRRGYMIGGECFDDTDRALTDVTCWLPEPDEPIPF